MKNLFLTLSLTLITFGLSAQVNGCFGYIPPVGIPYPPLGDDQSQLVALPFTFCFYGTNYNSVWVNDNGTLSLDQAHGTFTASGFPLPTTAFGAQAIIAPFWADFHQTGALSGPIYAQVLPNALIVHWENVGYFNTNHNVNITSLDGSTQIVL